MRHPHGETVTRLRGTPIADPYSGENTGIDWDAPQALEIPRCGVDGSRTREVVTADRGAVVTDFVIWPDAVYDVQAGDRLIVFGLTCEIVGRPWAPSNPIVEHRPGMEIFANVWEG